MAVIEELIRTETDSTISFGNYNLTKKSKVDNFEYHGDLYKVKTFSEITKLERNGMFVYESVPGTVVTNFNMNSDNIRFTVEGMEDAQITLELEEVTDYNILLDGNSIGNMKTNLSGKLNFSVELNEGILVDVEIEKK